MDESSLLQIIPYFYDLLFELSDIFLIKIIRTVGRTNNNKLLLLREKRNESMKKIVLLTKTCLTIFSFQKNEQNNKHKIFQISFKTNLSFSIHTISWCSGYHVSLTH